MTPRVELPRKIVEVLVPPSRYKVLYGGRGSSKSWSVARYLLVRALQGCIRILCAREIQTSIAESVHRLLSDQILALGLERYFDVGKHIIRCKSGSEFLFAGIRQQDISKIKSFEGADICWAEEAQTVTQRSWEVLIPTIRKPNSEIWVTFNPELEDDDTYQRFVVRPPHNALVAKVNWSDNPWFPDELREEMEHLKRIDPNRYAHIWEGECWGQHGEFFKREWFRWYEARPAHMRIYMASDFAVTQGAGDYTEHGVFGVDPDDNIYLLDWWYGQTSADEWIEALLDLAERWRPVTWFGEAGVIRKSIEPFLNKRMMERRVYFAVDWLASIHDKPTRARGFQARAGMGKIYVQRGNDMHERVLTQLTRFPAGKYDDAVDVCSLIGRALEDVISAHVPVSIPVNVNMREYVFEGEYDDDWKTV